MTPIHELLSRIRWDPQFPASRFVVGYWDRVAGRVLHADLRELSWDADNVFNLLDEEGGAQHPVPSGTGGVAGRQPDLAAPSGRRHSGVTNRHEALVGDFFALRR